MDWELVLQALAYTGVGLGVLVIGFIVLDLLTPGELAGEVMSGNLNASILTAATLFGLGLVVYFAIYFTGAGWSGLDNALIFGLVGVASQAIAFFILDLLTPGKLGHTICPPKAETEGLGNRGFAPGALMAASMQIAIALIVCASLT